MALESKIIDRPDQLAIGDARKEKFKRSVQEKLVKQGKGESQSL